MLQAMFAGVSGLQAHQTKMDVIGNNISNVNTVGFKGGRATFEDQLSQLIRASAGPQSSGMGGVNPSQVGLGVTMGSIDTIQTQGNLQTTGKGTDMAIQGGGFFLVSDGQGVKYTRDGSFDLDSSGTLVNPATGQRVLGYQADVYGNVDTSAPVTDSSAIRVPIGMLTDAKQTAQIGFSGNLDAAAALYSTKIDYSGNLDSAGGVTPSPITTTVYDSLGNSHTVQVTFANPVTGASRDAAGIAAGATQQWDVVVKVDNSTVYDQTSKSRLARVGGAWQFLDAAGVSLGSTLQLNGGAALNQAATIAGTNGAANISLDMNFGAMTNAAGAGTAPGGVADGQSGSAPTWGASIKIYDSLGVGHMVNFRYTHVPLGGAAPAGATARWDWVATENGVQVGASTDVGNKPLYFGNLGRMVQGASQTITISPTDGSVSPFTVTLDNSKMTQLASDANATANTQDGYPVGTLQSFTISPDGVVTGVFSSGQSRALGQVALASFANPAGLEKVGSNTYIATSNSGGAQVGVPNQSGRGKINTGFLEMSNVDLSTQFTDLIITQRGFQANTKIVTVVDELLQDVINLKR